MDLQPVIEVHDNAADAQAGRGLDLRDRFVNRVNGPRSLEDAIPELVALNSEDSPMEMFPAPGERRRRSEHARAAGGRTAHR